MAKQNKLTKILVIGVMFSIVLSLVITSVDALSVQYFAKQYMGNNADVWNAKVNLLNSIYTNNPDLFNKELQYERGIIAVLNLN